MRTHAQLTKNASAPISHTTHTARALTARQRNPPVLLQLQRTHGNQFVQRTLRTMVQAKLAVNRPGDRYEQEADRVAETAVRLPDAVVQRKCACDNRPGVSCEHCASAKEPLVQRKSVIPAPAGGGGPPIPAPAAAPPSVERALTSPGHPLPDAVRRDMEARLGHDFRATRVHDDDQAQESAREISARAYTVGRHIVFGPGQYQIGTTEGRQLLAHELVHVIQQTGSQTANLGAGLSGITVSGPAVQRAPEDSWGTFGDVALESALAITMIPSPLRTAAAASVRGFTAELSHQFSGNKDAIAGRLNELRHVDNLKSLFGGYYGGLLSGIVSPLTGLFDMLVFADRLRVLVNHMVADAANRFAELINAGRELVEAVGGIAAKVKEELSKLIAHPIDMIVSLVTDQGPSKLEAAANKAGHQAVIAMAGAVSKRFAPAVPTQGEAKEEAPLAQVDAKIEKLKESLFSTPWSKVGYDIGYAVGFAAVNILMLVFSGGVGNALTKLGSILGELGGVLGSAGRLVAVLGRGITFVEEAINAVMNVAMKPLQPLLRALEPHFQKLVTFLKKLLGLAEKESAEAAAVAAKTTAAAAKPKLAPAPARAHAPVASTHPSAPTPHATAPHPAIPPHAEAPGMHAGAQPHVEMPGGKAVEQQTGKALAQGDAEIAGGARKISEEAADRMTTNTYSGGGHDFKVLKNGRVVRCSDLCGDPYELLIEQYEEVIRANTHLDADLKRLKQLTATDPDAAAKLGAELEDRCARLSGSEFETGPARAVGRAEDPGGPLQPTTRGRAGIRNTEANEARRELRSNMPERPGAPGQHQAHHIIPYELRDHPLVDEMRRRFNFNINGRGNGVWLPTQESLSAGAEALHNTSHARYTGWVESELDQLAARYAKGEIAESQIQREFEDLIGKFENVARGSSFGRLDPATGVVRLR
jgi:hypothetical protein